MIWVSRLIYYSEQSGRRLRSVEYYVGLCIRGTLCTVILTACYINGICFDRFVHVQQLA